MPEQPFQALEIGQTTLGPARVRAGTLGHLHEHRQPHGDVKPIQHVLGLGADLRDQPAHGLATIRHQHEFLVGCVALPSKDIEQASPRTVIMRLNEGEALCGSLLIVLGGISVEARNGLASNHLKPRARAVAHETAVDTDVGGPVRQRQRVELALAMRPYCPAGLFADCRFVSASDGLQTAPHSFGCNRFTPVLRYTPQITTRRPAMP